jgi:hypothetical protein
MADLRAVLTNIYEKHGELVPQTVVDEARPKGAPLHERFEWNDKIAGDAYRCVQAAEIIRSVRIRFDVDGERKFTRGFVSARESGDTDRGGYVPTEEIVEDDLALQILLRELKREIVDLQRKYGHLKEFAGVLKEAVA